MTSAAPGHVHDSQPSPWIVRFGALVPAGASVLDLACGAGRHARWFAARGARVVAVDRDASLVAGLATVANVETRCVDLEAGSWPLRDARFDAIVVTNYLHRPSLQHLRAALAPGGVLLYETFARGNERYGRPSNPAFLLEPGELLAAFGRDLVVLGFEQGEVRGGPRPAVIQRIAAVDPARPWPVALP